MLKVPSGFLYQPSNAAVTLWPESCFGSSGNCSAADREQTARTNAAGSRISVIKDMLVTGALRGRCGAGLVFRKPILIVLLGDVSEVHPSMRHFVDRAVSPADPLIWVGIIRVRRRVVVPRSDMNTSPFRQHRRGI